MPRATTKADLVKTANEQFDKLWKMIDAMSEKEQNAAFCFDAERLGKEAHWKRDKNLRDVLVHLYEWHNLLIEWEKANTGGATRPFLPAPYTWKTYGDMNVGFWEKHQNTPLAKSKELFKDSHKKVLTVIDKYGDEQLFTKAFFKWTGGTSLGQYCISSTASHYDWAIKKLKAASENPKLCVTLPRRNAHLP